jgi:sugar/nucleoside kinase (ribokinase family)
MVVSNEVWTMGEMLVEIMRPAPDIEFHEAGSFLGPYPSGAPAIFIDTAARLGHSAAIIGGVGQDGFGRCLLERLNHDGVDCEYVKSFSNRSTAVAFVTYFKDGSRKFIFHIDNTPASMVEMPDMKNIASPRFFHLMGCSLMINKKFRDSILQTLKIFIQKGAKITFDPNIRVELLGENNIHEIISPVMENCSVLFPGVGELKLLTGEASIEKGIEKLYSENSSLEYINLKLGKKGCSIYTREDKFDISSFHVKNNDGIDPTGAGDCFDAGFLCGLLENKSVVESGRTAVAAGALNAAAFGPMEGDISPVSVRKLINDNR